MHLSNIYSMKLFSRSLHRTLFALFFSTLFFIMVGEASSFEFPRTLSGVRHDVGSGYDFLKWSFGSNKTDLGKDLSEASTFFKLAIANAQTDFQEGVINEDYPKLTLAALEQAVIQDVDEEGKCYAMTKSLRNTPPPYDDLDTQLVLPGAISQTPLGKRGLANTAGECAMDTSLQFLRMELLPLASVAADGGTVSFPGYSELNKNILHQPYLKKFLLNQITTDEGARALRLEMAQFIDWRLLKRPWDAFSNLSMGETGCVAGMSPQAENRGICAWLYLLYLPSAREVETAPSAKICPQTGEKYKYTSHLRQLAISFLGLDVAIPVSIDQVIQEDLDQRGRKMSGSLPPVMAYDLEPSYSGFNFPSNPTKAGLPFPDYEHERYDSSLIVGKLFSSISQNILDPVVLTLPSADNSSSAATRTTLTPSAITWSIIAQPKGGVGGHAYGVIQEGGNWYEMNNQCVFPIPKNWEKDLSLFIARYPIQMSVSYTTSEGSLPAPFVGRGAAVPSLFQALALHAKMVALCAVAPDTIDFLLNYTFYWWAFYKEHPDLRKNLDAVRKSVAAKALSTFSQ